MRQRKKNPSYCDGESLNTFRGIIAKIIFQFEVLHYLTEGKCLFKS